MHPSLAISRRDDGLLLRSELLAAGGCDADLTAARRMGIVVRLRAGTYAFRDQWEALTEVEQHVLRVRGVLHKAQAEAVASHLSAVAVHGAPMWELRLDEVHLTRYDRRGGRREAGVVQHRGALPDCEVTVVDGLPVTTPSRTAVDLASVVDVEHALPVVDDFLRRALATPEQLDACRRDSGGWPGTRATDIVLRLADARHESVGESRSCYLMYVGGVPYAEPQYVVLDKDGSVYARLDFAWPEYGVWLEFDGKQKYLKHRREGESAIDVVLREKRRQERIEGLTGWRCIRITWSDLERPRATADHILSVLGGGPIYR